MKNKKIKTLIFLIYTYYITNWFVILTIPFIWRRFGQDKAELTLQIIYVPFWLIIKHFRFPDKITDLLGIFGILPPLGYIFFIFSLPFTFWWQKQTIVRACAMTTTNMFAFVGVGIYIPYVVELKIPWHGVVVVAAVWLFYAGLYYGNKYQRKYYPNNKFCNAIRFILTWPCPRPPASRSSVSFSSASSRRFPSLRTICFCCFFAQEARTYSASDSLPPVKMLYCRSPDRKMLLGICRGE